MDINELWIKYSQPIKKKYIGKYAIDKNGFIKAIAEVISSPVEPGVKPANGDQKEVCWHCKEFEQHINGTIGYCHKHKFETINKVANVIWCKDFIHY